ncbi:MAG TPA: hypothetical protein VFW09_07405 [Solirubrobacteraceae bacterium]|nr:hypothetical protein [Solirubrobacteraceae bacterium]
MSTRRTKIIRRRIVAGAVVLAAAVSAPVAVAATSSNPSSSSKTAVHTQVQRDGTVQVSGYDGGVALQPSGR